MGARTLWKLSVGPKGARVMLRERRIGGKVRLFAYNPGTRQYRARSLGFTVRDATGRLVPEAQARAKKLAYELSNRLLAGERLSESERLPAVTLGEVARLYERERLPTQTPRSQEESRRLLACWRHYLGESFALERLDSATWSRFGRERRAGLVDGRGKVTVDDAGQPVPEPVERQGGETPKRKRRRRTKPVGANTIRKALRFLRDLCLFATNYRLPDGRYLLAGDPTRGMEIPKETDPKQPLIGEDRYAKLLGAATPRLRPLLVLAYDTGRRISAIVALRWDDWCPQEGLYGALVWRAAHDKIGRTWRVPVTKSARDAIAALEPRGPYLFPVKADSTRSITRTVATNWLRQAEHRAGLSHVPGGGWHMFRRAWATARKHLSLKDVAYAGGWSETSTLANIYQKPDLETLAQVVEGAREKIRAVK